MTNEGEKTFSALCADWVATMHLSVLPLAVCPGPHWMCPGDSAILATPLENHEVLGSSSWFQSFRCQCAEAGYNYIHDHDSR